MSQNPSILFEIEGFYAVSVRFLIWAKFEPTCFDRSCSITTCLGKGAYAAVRNLDAVKILMVRIETSSLLSDDHGIRFSIFRDTIFQRTRTCQGDREWAADFYSWIGNELDVCLRIQDKARWIDANQDFDVVLRKVKLAILD